MKRSVDRPEGTRELSVERTRIRNHKPKRVTIEDLTSILAVQVMKWGVAPDRFILEGRRWLPRWRFRPTERIEDAFRLLAALDPEEYDMAGRGAEQFPRADPPSQRRHW